VAAWLDRQAVQSGRVVAITHGGVVKAAVVHALGAPLEAFWRIDAVPLCAAELHAHEGQWTVARLNAPLTAESPVPA
jgi:broad specificity phosphatase PhoE